MAAWDLNAVSLPNGDQTTGPGVDRCNGIIVPIYINHSRKEKWMIRCRKVTKHGISVFSRFGSFPFPFPF